MTDDLLVQILDEVRGLRADLRACGLLPTGQAAGLVAAIAEAVGGREFTAVELIRHAEAAEGRLAALLAAGLGGKLTPRTVGKWLANMAGKSLDGLAIQRLGQDRNGAIWAVRPAGLA